MKKITFVSLFFCLAITTILAQITPDGSTNTSTTDSEGVFLINIAAPDTNGLSNNTYSDFNVSSDGVSLNNDVSNPNITDGNQASIIVNQVMGSNPSLLEGFLRTVGHGATIIIANPNGITCNGCQFITNGVGRSIDLVTGSYDIATRTYDSISDNDITIESGGFDAGSRTVNIQTNNLTNSGLLYVNILNLSLDGAFNNSGTVYVGNSFDAAVDSFNITATDFTNSGTITVTHDSFNAEVDNFSNESGATINADSFAVTANYFANFPGSTIDADTVTIEVPDFVNGIGNFGTVSSASLNFIFTDSFDSSTNFFPGFNNFSDLAITTNGTFTNNHTIGPDGNLTIAANTFTNNATINLTGNLTITAGYTAINQGSIVSGSLDVITADFFRNLTGGDIDVANLNIIAGGKVTNTANINVGTLTITANNDSTRTNDTTGFYVSNRGNITATSLNIAAVDNFYNRGNITATNFNITRAKSVFFLNREINSFYAAGHTYDGGTISLSGNSSFRADAGSIENYGNIDLGDNILDISADSFTNQAGANVTANTVNLINVNSFIDNGSITATVEFE